MWHLLALAAAGLFLATRSKTTPAEGGSGDAGNARDTPVSACSGQSNALAGEHFNYTESPLKGRDIGAHAQSLLASPDFGSVGARFLIDTLRDELAKRRLEGLEVYRDPTRLSDWPNTPGKRMESLAQCLETLGRENGWWS